MKMRRLYDVHTTTYLRRELRDSKTNRWMRCDIYAELLRRRHATTRRRRR